jgi:hypothetical protein
MDRRRRLAGAALEIGDREDLAFFAFGPPWVHPLLATFFGERHAKFKNLV